ncbi:arsenate reductase (thioredoxin) [Staphylococcus auricularis]|uniref:Arsenate reductase n=1 Tax=Staphylococcus auricularis TaxID=29379 RepID=A0ABX5IES7_9STAP|nr:arsenate reductase (thioredoxin) [Staphylococcus auricularis]MCE5038178.1 arsenate reductase (thioredoxin) [Staphylococcus auricularis]MEB6569303.1 arsenate reductase (thioredoxin) [Staphylococcus auricularis]PTH17445.1 arsenate reductase (thioredoxin) [Staphylococcus auricularis]PTH25627.1 arsenate reductase (thioredoxin) [Staphylococcus auricularis]
MNKKIVYFICTGNSCRSQIAEGWAKHILDDSWSVVSGGIEAHGINENAIKVMKEVGIDISHQTSTHIDQQQLMESTLVVTLCSDADQNCPYLPPHVKKEHWPFDDPAGQSLTEFRRVRDEIKTSIEQFNSRS